uniref:RING-type E3 ubiquitin transferase n=1 Tax=Branchiostoma floridae TaxID=7739 RepID=C3YGR0_BRAFL|eukprot:XP_002604559.1 hypothetical protein BRAFLDRAFT_79421 [Branchiostoma floridae]
MPAVPENSGCVSAGDPCLYIHRFAHKLEFGERTHEVSMTALRLVSRMKRDWMHGGRRPSGLCGAGVNDGTAPGVTDEAGLDARRQAALRTVCLFACVNDGTVPGVTDEAGLDARRQAALRALRSRYVFVCLFVCLLEVSMTALRLVSRMKRDWMHGGRRPSGLCGAGMCLFVCLFEVSMTALRLVSRMKRDWMHGGRQPSGLCGAALLVSARLHDFHRTQKEIIKVLEEQLDKEIEGELTSLEVEIEKELEREREKRMKKMKNLLAAKGITESDIRGTPAGSPMPPLEGQEDGTSSPGTPCSRVDSPSVVPGTSSSGNPPEQKHSEQQHSEQQLPQEQQLSEEEVMGKILSPFAGIAPALGPEPTPESLGIKDSLDECLKVASEKEEGTEDEDGEKEEGGELDLTGINDEELDWFLLNDEEVRIKTEIWTLANADYIQKMKEKEEKEALEKEQGIHKPEQKKVNKMAAAPSSLGAQFREELSCSICLELFTRPKVLPCQHTFCQDCLQDLAGKNKHLKCPNCRKHVWLSRKGVAGFRDNHLVTSLCERLQNQATVSGETREQPQFGNRCSFHPSEVLKVYCKQCQIPVCDHCLEVTHDGHGTTTIKKAAQERSLTVQPLINEGRNILEGYCSFIRGQMEEEKTLKEQKQQRDNSIIQAYNQMVQKVTESKDLLLSESQQIHRENLEKMQNERDRVLADVKELSAACDQAEQELQQGWVEFLSQQTALTLMTEVVGKYRGKAAPTPVQTQSAVFQPTDTPVPLLGHMRVQALPSAPIPAAPAPIPGAAVSSNDAAGGMGHHHGNQRQEATQSHDQVTFGEEGSGTGQFDCPCGVTVSDEGEIFVADRWNQRIQVFTLQGTFVRQFSTVVSGEEKMWPCDVAMDGEGNLWVVGETGDDISDEFAVQYNKQGRLLRKFDLQTTGLCRGVAVDTRRNHILITQSKIVNTRYIYNQHGEVLVFRPDGTLVRTVGQQQGMVYPWFITGNEVGNIFVLDCHNHHVYGYNEDGQFLFQFGGEGSGEGQLKNPLGICTDRAGNIIVADTWNNRVEMFDKAGKFLKHITTGKTMPHAIAMAPQGQLRRKPKKKQPIQASTAGEAIEKMLQEKKISSKINYDVLRDLNKETETKKPLEITPSRLTPSRLQQPLMSPAVPARTALRLPTGGSSKRPHLKVEETEEKPVVKKPKLEGSEVVVETGPVEYAKVEPGTVDHEEEAEDYYEEDEPISAAQLMGRTEVDHEDYDDGYDMDEYD